jgi:hypothetical protein
MRQTRSREQHGFLIALLCDIAGGGEMLFTFTGLVGIASQETEIFKVKCIQSKVIGYF